MHRLPQNKWIGLGFRLFSYFIFLVIASVFLSIIGFQNSGDIYTLEGIGMIFLTFVGYALPVSSIAVTLYGLFTMDSMKESGRVEGVTVVAVLGVVVVLAGYSFFGSL